MKDSYITSMRRTVDGFAREAIQPSIAKNTERFLAGGIDLAEWQKRVAHDLKLAHIIAASLGRGGREKMTFSDWGRVGQRLRSEYRYLTNFANEIALGNLSAAQIAARAELYVGGVKAAFYAGVTAAQKEDGAEWEQRLLGSGESCLDCIAWAAMGRQPVGSLPEPGERSVCGNNCLCRKVYGVYERVEEAA